MPRPKKQPTAAAETTTSAATTKPTTKAKRNTAAQPQEVQTIQQTQQIQTINTEPLSKTAYKYMGGSTYVVLPDGRVGWYFPADDGTWKFTEGQASRPFMYNTAEQLRVLLRR